jgi:plastocyanin
MIVEGQGSGMPMQKRLALYCGAAVLTLGVGVGCGGAGNSKQSNCATRNGARPPVVATGSVDAPGRIIDVEARDFAFHPTCMLGVPSGTVTLVVHNAGAQLHNVSIAAQHIDRDVAVGATVRIQVVVGREPVVFVCRYHRALGMVGVLVPVPAPATTT